jgi:hypothetical protein
MYYHLECTVYCVKRIQEPYLKGHGSILEVIGHALAGKQHQRRRRIRWEFGGDGILVKLKAAWCIKEKVFVTHIKMAATITMM